MSSGAIPTPAEFYSSNKIPRQNGNIVCLCKVKSLGSATSGRQIKRQPSRAASIFRETCREGNRCHRHLCRHNESYGKLAGARHGCFGAGSIRRGSREHAAEHSPARGTAAPLGATGRTAPAANRSAKKGCRRRVPRTHGRSRAAVEQRSHGIDCRSSQVRCIRP
jgi:hypothetical protein